MDQIEPTSLLDRITERLNAMGLSERAASLAAFGNPGGIRNVRHGQSKAPTLDFFTKLAPVLDVAPAWLAFGDNDAFMPPAESNAEGLFVIGTVAASHWRDAGEGEGASEYADKYGVLPFAPGYPLDSQYALVVKGASINRIASQGDVLICVDAKKSRYNPTPGDLVIAERRRYQGSSIETTAKRLRMGESGSLELWPESDHPAHQEPIVLGTDDGDETVEVSIIGKVAFAIRQLDPNHPAKS